MLKDVLLDVVKHTNGLGFIEAVKIEGTASETSISAMDVDRTVMLYGQLHNAVSEFEGTFGACLLYTSPSPRDATLSRMPSSA